MKLFALFVSLLALSFAACNQANNAVLQQVPPDQSANCVNINKASAGDLNALQGIGETMAQKIIAYRKRHGGFRRPQELIIIDGFSEKKYRAIAERICVD